MSENPNEEVIKKLFEISPLLKASLNLYGTDRSDRGGGLAAKGTEITEYFTNRPESESESEEDKKLLSSDKKLLSSFSEGIKNILLSEDKLKADKNKVLPTSTVQLLDDEIEMAEYDALMKEKHPKLYPLLLEYKKAYPYDPTSTVDQVNYYRNMFQFFKKTQSKLFKDLLKGLQKKYKSIPPPHPQNPINKSLVLNVLEDPGIQEHIKSLESKEPPNRDYLDSLALLVLEDPEIQALHFFLKNINKRITRHAKEYQSGHTQQAFPKPANKLEIFQYQLSLALQRDSVRALHGQEQLKAFLEENPTLTEYLRANLQNLKPINDRFKQFFEAKHDAMKARTTDADFKLIGSRENLLRQYVTDLNELAKKIAKAPNEDEKKTLKEKYKRELNKYQNLLQIQAEAEIRWLKKQNLWFQRDEITVKDFNAKNNPKGAQDYINQRMLNIELNKNADKIEKLRQTILDKYTPVKELSDEMSAIVDAMEKMIKKNEFDESYIEPHQREAYNKLDKKYKELEVNHQKLDNEYKKLNREYINDQIKFIKKANLWTKEGDTALKEFNKQPDSHESIKKMRMYLKKPYKKAFDAVQADLKPHLEKENIAPNAPVVPSFNKEKVPLAKTSGENATPKDADKPLKKR